MKRNVTRAIYFATILLSVAVVASAQDYGACSMGGRAGTFAFTWTGTMILPAPAGAVQAAGVGRTTFDADGNMTGTQIVSRGGVVSLHTIKGTYTVNPDCTGTLSITNYDATGTWVSKATWYTVSVDNMNETRLIMTSMVSNNGTPNGLNVPVVITNTAAKLFPAKM